MIDNKKLLEALQHVALATDPDRAAPFLHSIDTCLVFLVGIHQISPHLLARDLSICSESYIRNRCRIIGIPPLKRGGNRRVDAISNRLTLSLWQTHTATELAEMLQTSVGYIRYLGHIKGFTRRPPESDEASLYTFD